MRAIVALLSCAIVFHSSAVLAKEYSKTNIKVVREVSKSNSWDYEFCFLRKTTDGTWRLFNHIETQCQKYKEPELFLLEDNLFCLKRLADSGIGVCLYEYDFYVIEGKQIRKLLEIPCEGNVFGWGMALGREFNSRLKYSHHVLTVNYFIKVYPYDEKSTEISKPLFTANRRAIFKWNGAMLSMTSKSDLSRSDLKNLYNGDEQTLRRLFKNEFQKLKTQNNHE